MSKKEELNPNQIAAKENLKEQFNERGVIILSVDCRNNLLKEFKKKIKQTKGVEFKIVKEISVDNKPSMAIVIMYPIKPIKQNMSKEDADYMVAQHLEGLKVQKEPTIGG